MVNYHLAGNPVNSIVINYDGETYPISKEDFRFADILRAISEERLDDVPALVKMVENKFTGNGVEFKDNEIFVDGESIPEEIANRILQFKEQGLPTEYLAKFAQKLKNNVSYNTRQALFLFLEHNGHAITKDGNFIAYKGVRADFKDLHSGRFDNSVGQTVEIPRSAVDDNPNNLCSPGLHVACYDYAKSNYGGQMLLEVEVDPSDVVCVPKEYQNTKMRVCKYKVLNICKNVFDGAVYNYSQINEDMDSDEEFDGDGGDDDNDWDTY